MHGLFLEMELIIDQRFRFAGQKGKKQVFAFGLKGKNGHPKCFAKGNFGKGGLEKQCVIL